MPGLAGLVVATGLGSHGLTYGPVLGECAARLVQGESVGLPIDAYRPDRPG